MKDFLNRCYDEEGNYNIGTDPVAWICTGTLFVMALIWNAVLMFW